MTPITKTVSFTAGGSIVAKSMTLGLTGNKERRGEERKGEERRGEQRRREKKSNWIR